MTLFYEIKKIYYYQKGLIVVFLFILLTTMTLLLTDKPTDSSVEKNLSQYMTYLEKVEGVLTEETENFFLVESQNINTAKAELNKLYDIYYDGKISENEFLLEQNRIEILLSNQEGFELLYEQYIYVRENPENRYFLYRNGWDGLISNEALDFLLILTILILITPIYCQEYSSEMDTLSLTTEKGGFSEAKNKIAVALFSVIILTSISIGIRYVFFKVKYGLEGGNFPLQSLVYFSSSTKNLSLMETFLCISIIKILGSALFSIMILFFSVCFKKYTITLFASTALVLIPFVGLSEIPEKYTFAEPLGFMLGTGFFRGSIYQTNPFTKENIQIFQEIPVNLIMWTIIGSVCTSLFLIFLIKRIRSSQWNPRKCKKFGKKISTMFLVSVLLVNFSGCKNTKPISNIVFNSSFSSSYETDSFKFYVDETNLEDIKLIFENKETGKTENLVRDPLKSSFQVANTLFVNHQKTYYIKQNINKSGFKDYIDHISIISVDMNSLTERVIYERNMDSEAEFLMGAISINHDNVPFLHGIASFFIDENERNAYFISDSVYRVNLSTGEITSLEISTNSNVAFDGRKIYYIGEQQELSYYDTVTNEYCIVPKIITTKFFFHGDRIIFLNRLDQNKLYSLLLENKTLTKLMDKTALYFYSDANFIYYQDPVDLLMYTINL